MPPETYDLSWPLDTWHPFTWGDSTGEIFSCLEWMVTVISTESFSLEEENIPVFGGYTDDTHGGISSQKMVWSSSHILATEPYITGAAAAGTGPCYPCGWSHQDGVAGQRLWHRPGLPSKLLPYQQCDLGKSLDFLKPGFLYLGTIRLCTRVLL